MTCHACGTALSSGARFCHKCGTTVAASPRRADTTDWRAGLPWGLAGLAVGALVTVLAVRGGGRGGAGAAAPEGAPAPSTMDISQMSPEEMARRLFNRVMRLAE